MAIDAVRPGVPPAPTCIFLKVPIFGQEKSAPGLEISGKRRAIRLLKAPAIQCVRAVVRP